MAYKNGFIFNNEPFTGSAKISDIVPNLLLIQSWLPGSSALSWNYPSWSISIEYYMYIIFYISILIKSSLRYILWFVMSIIMFILVLNGTEIGKDIFSGLSCFFNFSCFSSFL
jgi:peptidoglycan/LPS O-acetylase OafA/YrhL